MLLFFFEPDLFLKYLGEPQENCRKHWPSNAQMPPFEALRKRPHSAQLATLAPKNRTGGRGGQQLRDGDHRRGLTGHGERLWCRRGWGWAGAGQRPHADAWLLCRTPPRGDPQQTQPSAGPPGPPGAQGGWEGERVSFRS